jgi:hypothetical protein
LEASPEVSSPRRSERSCSATDHRVSRAGALARRTIGPPAPIARGVEIGWPRRFSQPDLGRGWSAAMPTMSGRGAWPHLIGVGAGFTLPDFQWRTLRSMVVVSAVTAMAKEVKPDEGRAQQNPDPVVR